MCACRICTACLVFVLVEFCSSSGLDFLGFSSFSEDHIDMVD